MRECWAHVRVSWVRSIEFFSSYFLFFNPFPLGPYKENGVCQMHASQRIASNSPRCYSYFGYLYVQGMCDGAYARVIDRDEKCSGRSREKLRGSRGCMRISDTKTFACSPLPTLSPFHPFFSSFSRTERRGRGKRRIYEKIPFRDMQINFKPWGNEGRLDGDRLALLLRLFAMRLRVFWYPWLLYLPTNPLL